MRLFKLLEGLYRELKTFNENVEYFSFFDSAKKRRVENYRKNGPASFHSWIHHHLVANDAPGWMFMFMMWVNAPEKLLSQDDEAIQIRKFVSEKLDCGCSSNDLQAVYQKEKAAYQQTKRRAA